MSKLIESLKSGIKDFPKENKTVHQMTQEQLAEIYFSGSDKTRRPDTPMIIKVVEKSPAVSIIPWLIASLAFFLMALSLFSTKRIFVDIKVIDEKSPYLAALQQIQLNPFAYLPGHGLAAPVSQRISPLEFSFEGASKLKSAKTEQMLTLVNSSVAHFARANVYFESPLDLSQSKIIFYAKGKKGGESVTFSVKDRDNVSAFERGDLNPFPDKLTTQWQKGEILLTDETAQAFNPRGVSSMRFEFGARQTKNKPGDTIFIKDLQIVKI
jgi:hypothetical protein